MKSKTKKVLIVSLRAGAGHIKAAEAIEKAIEQENKKLKNQKNKLVVQTIDFLDYSNILSKTFYSKWYIDLVKYAPQLYKLLYEKVSPTSTIFRLVFDRINAQPFKKYITQYKPDIVICTHFVAANILNHWKKKYGFKYQVWLTITDYEAHSLWVDRDVDMNFVALPEVADYLVQNGIDKKKIKITGIPIDLKFTKKYDKNKILKKFGLNKGFTISVFSGGFGMGPVEEIVRNIGSIGIFGNIKINILVVAGKNEELKKKLEVITEGNKNLKIYGFVNNMEEFMAVSDLIISKPGGLTVSESMAMGVPLIMSNPIPGQEDANVRFLLKNKAGLRADEPDEVVKLIKKILKNKSILVRLKRNLKRIAKPRAVLDIIRNIR
jgi:processive 1,2-diacylglycerol beta-glucosyltransferase